MLGFFNGQVGKLNRVFAITGIAAPALPCAARQGEKLLKIFALLRGKTFSVCPGWNLQIKALPQFAGKSLNIKSTTHRVLREGSQGKKEP